MKYFYIRKKKKITNIIKIILEEIFLRKCNISEISSNNDIGKSNFGKSNYETSKIYGR